ncbi:hypothetical protein [Rhodoferax sp.]|uniref:hypothetical protein n=1 Tax=Rhodoferax sp. TaxID=50421 RepID=UPI00262615F5|nr:hypothetical protein [Rhodoferax sp.]MDD3937975.1 hypothetical protein [Rhodoferax sp.]
MKREAFDPSVCDISTSQRSGSLPASELLVCEAHANWMASLQLNGNQPSLDHQHAGWQLLRAMVDQLYGVRTGRYAYALPCGAGKTQAVVALLALMASLGVFSSGKTVLVVAQQVKALCEIKQKLLDADVPEQSVGIVHSKADAAFPSTGDQKRPITLATHARIQQDGSLPECCLNKEGKLHDLVIWDEALISTEVVTLTLDTTLTALRHFANSGKCPAVAEAYERLALAVEREQAAQLAGQPACELSPTVTEQEAELMQQEMRAIRYLDSTGNTLRDHALSAISLIRNPISLVDPRNGNSAALMRYVVKVPDALANIVILDASHAIDELRQADSTIRVGTTEAMTNFKDFGTVAVVHHPVASGRSTMKDDGKAISEAVRIAKELPQDERVLFVTFKDWYEGRLMNDLRAAGVPVQRTMPNGVPWLNIVTWGKHTSDNSYTDCRHVVLVGLHRLPRLALASQLAAQKRDLTHRRNKSGLLDLEQSVIAGDVMQAMNRGCMRLTDAEGKAHPMTAHIIAKDDLRHLLEKAMPGLRWETLAIKSSADDKPLTKTHQAAGQIVDYVKSLPAHVLKVSLKAIYVATGITLGKDAKAEAVTMALAKLHLNAIWTHQLSWTREGLSLARKAV